MVRFLKLLIIAPFAILFLIFAFANRHFVAVSLDPFTSVDDSAYSLDAPLFILLILAMILGVVMGGVAVWFGQGKHRRAARASRAGIEKLRADLQAAKSTFPPASGPISRRA
jgi:uncharacterized integral membrane protein